MMTLRFAELATYQDNWDEDGAPAPNSIALSAALRIAESDITPFSVIEVDADALGGVVLWIEKPNQGKCWSWISIRNSGSVLLTHDDREGDVAIKSVGKIGEAGLLSQLRRLLKEVP